jgi:transcription elongation factor Elf1
MIVWGSRGRQMKLGSGEFNCPRCNTKRTYTHKRSTVYFTLYFIPLFKVRDLGEYVECDTCKQSYEMSVLKYEPPTEAERMMASVQLELEAGLPIHMATKKLVSNGVSETDSKEVVRLASRGLSKTCTDCKFEYISTVTLCSNCGGRLELT